MNPYSKKNQDMIKKYPFLIDILLERTEPFDGQSGISINDLNIRIEKADGDLMFHRADNVGLGDSSCVFQLKGNRKDQVMRRGEYLLAIGHSGKIINFVNWPRNDEERRKTGEVYAWTVFWSERGSNGHYSSPIWDKVKYLAWVTVEAWHMDTKNDGISDRFGEFRDRSVHVTIYCEPDHGFKKLQEDSNIYENLFLDERLIMRGTVERDYDMVRISGMLQEMCITFQDEVYFNGMKDVLDKGKFRGASGQFGVVKVLCANMCGYDRVMLEDALCYITFQLQPDSKHMYVLGYKGTLPRIRNLVRTVMRTWNQKSEARAAFKTDKNVSCI